MVNQGESVVIDDQEYLCADTIELDGKQYLYLITATDSIEFCFAEQTIANGELQIRLIGNQPEKHKILTALQAKIEQSTQN